MTHRDMTKPKIPRSISICRKFGMGFRISITCHQLTHGGRVTHICVCYLTIIGSDNGLLPGRHQVIIRSNTGILLNGPLGTNFSEIIIKIEAFPFKKKHFKVLFVKWQPICLGLNELKNTIRDACARHWSWSWLYLQMPYCLMVMGHVFIKESMTLNDSILPAGPLFTKKTSSYGYRDPHYKPKTVWRPSQVYNGNSYTDKTGSS